MGAMYFLSIALLFAVRAASEGCELIVNGGFEIPILPEDSGIGIKVEQIYVPGWRTTRPDKVIDIASADFWSVMRAEDEQLLIVDNTSFVYQDLDTEPGTVLTWKVNIAVSQSSYYHTDAGAVHMGPASGQLVKQGWRSGSLERWRVLNGTYVVPAGQTVTRFALQAEVSQMLFDEASVTTPNCPPTKFPPTTVLKRAPATKAMKRPRDPTCYRNITLVNPGFEEPKLPSGNPETLMNSVPGWKGNGPIRCFRAHRDSAGQDFNPYSGQQACMLPMVEGGERGWMYQDFDTTPGTTLKWTIFTSDNRMNRAVPVLGIDLGPPNGPASRQQIKALASWYHHSGEYKVPVGQTKTRIQISSLDGGMLVPLDNIQIAVVGCDDSFGVPTMPPPPPEENPDVEKCIQNFLQNGDFESPVLTKDEDYVDASSSHWESAADRGLTRLMRKTESVQPVKGNQLAYVIRDVSLSQTVTTNPGDVLYWSFHHRALSSVDPSSVALTIDSPTGGKQRLEVKDVDGTIYNRHSGRYVVPLGQTQTRFTITGVAGSNFLDDVQFGPVTGTC